jgi:hypothetical protein
MESLFGTQKGGGLVLLKDEKILRTIKPHYLAFWDMFLIWAWIIALSIVFLSFGEEFAKFMDNPLMYVTGFITAWSSPRDSMLLNNIPAFSDTLGGVHAFISPINDFMRSYAPVGLWVSAIFASAMVVSVLKIEWKWIAIMMGVGVLSMLLTYLLELPAEGSYYLGMLFSVLGIIGVELYRRAHTFYITDKRIVTEVEFTAHKRNELSYDKINNLILDQGLLGRVFDFGTLIPVTASGLGMGTDFSAVTVGAGGPIPGAGIMAGGAVTGGRMVQTPRVRSMYGIFGVSEPEKVQEIVSEYLHAYVEAPYLMKMSDQLEELTKHVKGDGQ